VVVDTGAAGFLAGEGDLDGLTDRVIASTGANDIEIGDLLAMRATERDVVGSAEGDITVVTSKVALDAD